MGEERVALASLTPETEIEPSNRARRNGNGNGNGNRNGNFVSKSDIS